ncbi:MAG: Fur family transcriptional regulator [Clostridia bacterium]|nr:Fur family transcriptional regulator [Clostridia bacterium]MDD4376142.1 Fur family transcriptional regulator [Clostridia bacterium]
MKKRNTKQRDKILELLRSKRKEHLTALEIVELLGEFSIGQATVYRNLNIFEKEGVLRKYVGNGEKTCYQYIDAHKKCKSHYHIICEACTKTIHTHIESVENIEEELINNMDFKINKEKIALYGICNKCK